MSNSPFKMSKPSWIYTLLLGVLLGLGALKGWASDQRYIVVPDGISSELFKQISQSSVPNECSASHLVYSKGHHGIPVAESIAELEEVEEDHFPEDDTLLHLAASELEFLSNLCVNSDHYKQKTQQLQLRSLVVLYHRWKMHVIEA